MARYRRKFYCIDCGKYTIRLLDNGQKQRCHECAYAAMIVSTQSMAGRTGPYYLNWLNSAGPKGRPRKQ